MSGGGELRKGITIVDVVALGVGASVGVSIFSIMAPAAKVAGPGLLLALVVAVVPMAVFAVVYAFMGSTVPRSGASYDWPARFVHPFVGFMVAWLRIVGNTGALIVLSLVLVSYARRVVPLPERPTMFALLLLFFLFNLFGVKVAAGVERVLVLVKILAFALFVALGISAVRAEHFTPQLAMGWGGVFAALPLLISLYMGIESATEVGEEIRDGTAVIAKGLAAATTLSALTYFAVSAVALGVLGAPALAASQAPLLDAGNVFLGRWATPLILGTAIAAIGTSINAIFMTFTRFLFAMGRDGVLPAALASVHPRWGTPHVATTVAFGCSLLGLLLPSSLVFLFLAVNIPTMLKYLSNCWSAERLVTNHPELRERARFRLGRRAVKAWSYTGIAFALIIIAAGVEADWRPYAILAGWAVVGTAYWLLRGRRTSRSMAEREAVEPPSGVARGFPA